MSYLNECSNFREWRQEESECNFGEAHGHGVELILFQDVEQHHHIGGTSMIAETIPAWMREPFVVKRIIMIAVVTRVSSG